MKHILILLALIFSMASVNAQSTTPEQDYQAGLEYSLSKNHKQAVYWYKKAAKQGHANAQYNLGYMYYNGVGVPQSLVQAHMWFNISNANGPVPYRIHGRSATHWRDIVIATKMSVAEKAEAQRLAIKCIEKYENCGY